MCRTHEYEKDYCFNLAGDNLGGGANRVKSIHDDFYSYTGSNQALTEYRLKIGTIKNDI